MRRLSSSRLIVTYILSLTIAVALLVGWVIYVLRSQAKINELAARVGVGQENFHWWILGAGCLLFGLLLSGVTFQLAQALSERRYADKLQEFVSNMTHELKSPLAAIRLHAETLRQNGVNEEEKQRFLGYILQQQERMSALVDNLLQISRLVARRSTPALEPVNLRRFFETYLEEAEARVLGQGCRLMARVETDASVLAPPGSLHHVLDNLLDNAVRFSSAGDEVRCSVSDNGLMIRIVVEDDGVGIPKGELRKIFDRFYQIGRGRQGTGLGLAIVEGLVKEMRGTVRAVSHEENQGTRFEVELPLAETR